MEVIKEFMRKYFADQNDLDRAAIAKAATFRKRFFTAEFVAEVDRGIAEDEMYEKANPSKIESIQAAGGCAKVVAIETRVGSSQRRIYYLQSSNGSWQIDRKGIECFNCDGSGNYDGQVCSSCNGEGWRFFGASDR